MEHKNIAEKLGLMDPLSHDKFVDQELQGLSDDLVGPLMVAWDVTNRCNLKCMHCLNRSGDERYHDFSNELSSSEAIDVCRQIIELNPYSVCLCGGEPLLRTDFFDIVQTLVPHIQNVNAVSNGYIVDAQLAERIADSGLTMFQVSLDSAHEEMHNQFRANSDSFRRALNAIKTLSTHSSIQVAASFCPTRFNIPYFREYVQMLMDAGCFSIRVMPLLPMGRGLDNYRNSFYHFFCTDDIWSQGMKAFSRGEIQKIRLLRSLTKETANFLILDEPSSFMDFESSNELMSVLQSVRNDRIILLISHDPIYSESDFIKISI